jgi:hypothetical protein
LSDPELEVKDPDLEIVDLDPAPEMDLKINKNYQKSVKLYVNDHCEKSKFKFSLNIPVPEFRIRIRNIPYSFGFTTLSFFVRPRA